MAKDLTVKTLHKVVDWLVNDSNENVCEICAYCRTWMECFYRRTNGTTACRNGIIEHFQTEASKGK